MNDRAIRTLGSYLDEAKGIERTEQVKPWERRVSQFLQVALGREAALGFDTLYAEDSWHEFSMKLGHLEGLLAKDNAARDSGVQETATAKPALNVQISPYGRRVFLVHGSDHAAKEAVKQFLTRLDLDPVILHEQPNQGRTIIEKFEVSSNDVVFAVVLLTADDTGGAWREDGLIEMGPRARQNVVLELGYFMGRLGRSRVCALYDGVELPSDFQGVVYIPFDAAGAWKAKLAQELVEAKLPINLKGLLGG